MCSGAVIYVPSFIKIGSGIQKLMGFGVGHTDTNSNVISQAYSIFQNKESRLKRRLMISLCCLPVYPPLIFWFPLRSVSYQREVGD
jgi:hypothetical protein